MNKWLEGADFVALFQNILSNYDILDDPEHGSFTITSQSDGFTKRIFITSDSDGNQTLVSVIKNIGIGEDAICLHQVNSNHWVALNVKKEANNKITCTVANSLPQRYTHDEHKKKISFPQEPPNNAQSFTANDYTWLKKDEEGILLYSNNSYVIDSTYYSQIEDAISKNGSNDFAGKITLEDWPTEQQQNTYDCGIHSALNAVDMAMNNAHTKKCCTKNNVSNCRKWLDVYKEEENCHK